MNALNNWRKHRKAARVRAAIETAAFRTSSPAMRDELLTIANSQGINLNR